MKRLAIVPALSSAGRTPLRFSAVVVAQPDLVLESSQGLVVLGPCEPQVAYALSWALDSY